jgi:peptidoglycan/xylan/chitin deacetylase (PgdA/CDA1 family)
MAKAHPELVRRAYQEGHTIGTHSMNHPYPFRAQGLERSRAEIDGGIAATATALGKPKELAPFFRFPGLGRTDPVEGYLASRGLMVWSADFPADDWKRISASEIVHRALRRLEAKGKGVLLLHDIHPATRRSPSSGTEEPRLSHRPCPAGAASGQDQITTTRGHVADARAGKIPLPAITSTT